MLADRLFAAIAEETLRSLVPDSYMTREVRRNDRVVDLVDNLCLQPQCLFSALSFGDIVAHAKDFPHVPSLVECGLIRPGDPYTVSVPQHVLILVSTVFFGLPADVIDHRF